MKKLNWDWVIVVIILALVIGIGIEIYLSNNDKPLDFEQKDHESKLDIVKRRIKALEQRVKDEIALLNLSTEMETALSGKVDRICIVLGIVFWLIIISIAVAFYLNGFDLLTSILNTAGVVSLTFPLVSIVLWRTVDFKSVVDITRRSIKNWLNKKYGHNPDSITVLNATVVELNTHIEKHNQELNNLSKMTR